MKVIYIIVQLIFVVLCATNMFFMTKSIVLTDKVYFGFYAVIDLLALIYFYLAEKNE